MNVDRLDLNLLVALRALLAERHVTRAARRIGLSQPAMSHALARLRKELRDPILVRTAKGMRPTARAEAIAEPLERAFGDLARVLEPPEAFDPRAAERRFVIATSDYVELVLLPRLCARLWKEAPGVALRVVNLGATADPELADGSVDLAIGLDVMERDASAVRQQLLFAETFVCIVREDHPVARRGLTVDDFVSLPHALVSPRGQAGGGIVDRALGKLGRKRRVALEIPHFLVAPHVVRETDVVMTLASRVADVLGPALGVRRLAPPVGLPLAGFRIAMQWHERRHRDPAHAWLRGLVADVARTI